MKVRSIIPLPHKATRLGVERSIIEVDFKQTFKDNVLKEYHFMATDCTIDDPIQPAYPDGRKVIASATYIKSYAEYDAQRAYLLSIDGSGLIGSELEDKLLQDALFYSLQADPIYESVGSDWVRYFDPILVAEPPTTEPPTTLAP
jgi:hypothetical protein